VLEVRRDARSARVPVASAPPGPVLADRRAGPALGGSYPRRVGRGVCRCRQSRSAHPPLVGRRAPQRLPTRRLTGTGPRAGLTSGSTGETPTGPRRFLLGRLFWGFRRPVGGDVAHDVWCAAPELLTEEDPELGRGDLFLVGLGLCNHADILHRPELTPSGDMAPLSGSAAAAPPRNAVWPGRGPFCGYALVLGVPLRS